MARINLEEGIDGRISIDNSYLHDLSNIKTSPHKSDKAKTSDSVEFTPANGYESYNSPPKMSKRDFSLARLQLDKLSGPNSTNKENKMVDYFIKKTSPSKIVDTIAQQTIRDVRDNNEKVKEYIKSMSKKTTPNKYTRPTSNTNSN